MLITLSVSVQSVCMLSIVSIFVIKFFFHVSFIRPLNFLRSRCLVDAPCLQHFVLLGLHGLKILGTDCLSSSTFVSFLLGAVNSFWEMGCPCLTPLSTEISLVSWSIYAYSCSSFGVDIFKDSITGFLWTCCSQYLKCCLMFCGVKCFFKVNIFVPKLYIELGFFCQLIECLIVVSCPEPFLKPAYPFGRHWSRNFSIPLCNIPLNNLYLLGSRLKGLPFFISLMSPFLSSMIVLVYFHFTGFCLSS